MCSLTKFDSGLTRHQEADDDVLVIHFCLGDIIVQIYIVILLMMNGCICIHNQKSDRSRRSRLDLSDDIDPVRWKITRSSDYYRDAHYYVIISHNTSVPTIGHLELPVGLLTSHAAWAWLVKICVQSQIFLGCVRADLGLIMNVEHFARIDQVGQIFDHECNHCHRYNCQSSFNCCLLLFLDWSH